MLLHPLVQAIEVGEDTFGGCTLYAAHSPQRAQVNCWPCDCPSSSAQSTAKSSQKMDDAADGGGENDVSSSDHLSDHSTTSSSSDSARNGNGTSTILDEVEEGGDTSTPCDLASADSCGCTCVVPGTSSSSGSGSKKKNKSSSSSSSSSSGSSDASSSSSSPKPLLPRLPRAAADWVGCALPKSLPSASKASRPCPQMLNPGHNTPPWDDIVLQVIISAATTRMPTSRSLRISCILLCVYNKHSVFFFVLANVQGHCSCVYGSHFSLETIRHRSDCFFLSHTA